MAVATKKKAKNCKKGKPCGNSCVPQTSNCKTDKTPPKDTVAKPKAVPVVKKVDTKPEAKKTTTRISKKKVEEALAGKGITLTGVSGKYFLMKDGVPVGTAKTLTEVVQKSHAISDTPTKTKVTVAETKKPEIKKEVIDNFKFSAPKSKIDLSKFSPDERSRLSLFPYDGLDVRGTPGNIEVTKGGVVVGRVRTAEQAVQAAIEFDVREGVKTNVFVTERVVNHPNTEIGRLKQEYSDSPTYIQEKGRKVLEALKLDIHDPKKDPNIRLMQEEIDNLKKDKEISAFTRVNEITMREVKIDKKLNEIVARNQKELEKITNLLKANSSVSIESSRKYAEWVEFSGFPKEEVSKWREWLVEYDQITDGKFRNTVRRIEASTTDTRAYASEYFKKVSMGNHPMRKAVFDDEKKKTFFHELGHHIEYNAIGMNKVNKAYIAQNRTSSKLEKLKDITGIGYGDGEMGYRGNFVKAYVSKDYGSNSKATEVFTMGIQQLGSAKEFTSQHQSPYGRGFLEYTIGNLLNNYEIDS